MLVARDRHSIHFTSGSRLTTILRLAFGDRLEDSEAEMRQVGYNGTKLIEETCRYLLKLPKRINPNERRNKAMPVPRRIK